MFLHVSSPLQDGFFMFFSQPSNSGLPGRAEGHGAILANGRHPGRPMGMSNGEPGKKRGKTDFKGQRYGEIWNHSNEFPMTFMVEGIKDMTFHIGELRDHRKPGF